MNQLIQKTLIIFSLTISAFASASFAECHLGSDGNQYCGEVCSLNGDGTWACYNDNHYDNRPVECHLGADGNQYCGHECRLNSNGTWSCD